MLRGQLHLVPVSDYKNKRYRSIFKWQTCSLCENQFRNETGQVCTIGYSVSRIGNDATLGMDYKYTDDRFGYTWDVYYFCANCVSKYAYRIRDLMKKEMEKVLVLERCKVKPLE